MEYVESKADPFRFPVNKVAELEDQCKRFVKEWELGLASCV